MVRYRLNSPHVIHETVDGEALVIHALSGVYFSLQGTAEQVWSALLAGHTAAEIASAYANGDIAAETVEAEVEQFARQLRDEELVVVSDQPAAGMLPPPAGAYSTPVLQRFTDMQELLLVDPIHEVDPQAGWPTR